MPAGANLVDTDLIWGFDGGRRQVSVKGIVARSWPEGGRDNHERDPYLISSKTSKLLHLIK